MQIGIDGNEANISQRVGSGQYAFELLKRFAQVKKHLFLVYFKEKPQPDLPKESVHLKYLIFGPQKFWTQFALPLKLFFGPKIDVFFTPSHYGPRFAKMPQVITVFDLSYLHFPQMFKKNDLYQLTNWTKYSISNASHILTISYSSKKDIVKNYQIDPSRITVTYPGYDEENFRPQSKVSIDKIRAKYKISRDYLIFVGTLQPRKNLERLIKAFASIVHSSQFTIHGGKKTVNNEQLTNNLSLVIAGKRGWFYDSIFAKVKSLSLDQKIIFTDYVPDDDLPALISGARAYVLPSLWEGFGIPVIEAQACGVPVVVSSTASLPEIVGESGILVNPESVESIAQGIKEVLTNEKTRSDLVKKGFENIKRFSWQNCAQETLKALEKVVSKQTT